MSDEKQLQALRGKAETALKGNSDNASAPNEPSSSVDALLEELQVYQMELEIQNQELREAQVEAERERQKYYSLFYALPIAGFVMDAEGIVLQHNHQAEALFPAEQGKHIKGMGLMRLFEQPGRAWLHQQLTKKHVEFSVCSENLQLNQQGTRQYHVYFSPIMAGGDAEPQYLLLVVESQAPGA